MAASTPHAQVVGEPSSAPLMARKDSHRSASIDKDGNRIYVRRFNLEGTEMQYARLGNTGLWVSRLCVGIRSFDAEENRPADWKKKIHKIIERSIALGINFFDANVGVDSLGTTEKVLSEALKKLKAKRAKVVIATKVYCMRTTLSPDPFKDNSAGLGRKHIFEACEASLKRLDTEYIDLYIVHGFDPYTPIKETMCALNDLVRSGKVRYIGASNMCTWQFAKAQTVAEQNGWTTFISMQNAYNLVCREEEHEMIRYCLHSGIGFTPCRPLAGGMLSVVLPSNENSDEKKEDSDEKRDDAPGRANSWADYKTDANNKTMQRLNDIAQRRNATPTRVALAWNLAKPGITSAIIGVTTLEQLNEYFKALSMELTNREITYLENFYVPNRQRGI